MPMEQTVVEAGATVDALRSMASAKHREVIELKELIRKNKENLEGRFLDDSTYDSLSNVLENKRKERSDRKKYLITQMGLQGDIDVIKEQQEELKDAKSGLSEYLKAINSKTHQLSFDDYLGRKRTFNISARPGKVLPDKEGGEKE